MVRVTGLPVRQEIMTVDETTARRNLALRADCFTLLVFGGSRGAMSINRAMLDLMVRCQQEDMQIIWITGEAAYAEIELALRERIDYKQMKGKLLLSPYMYNMPEAMAVADLALCRAGASTLCELAVLGLPAVLVPYPYAAENHQEKNARAWLEKNAVEMIIDEFLDGDTLYKHIMALKDDRARLEEMSHNISSQARPNALKEIADIILAG